MSPVIFSEHVASDNSVIVEITLNAPKALNALSYEMIQLITPKLEQYAQDPKVVAIILDSEGEKAFCAGGDVVSLYHSLQDPQRQDFCQTYFAQEYQLDQLIHTYPKPIIAWGSGIVMGGGIGLLAGCSHRVVTQTSMLAMPEVTIGLYPDVGASWFLHRFPGGTGLFSGLTGARLNAQDALFVGLADRILDVSQRAELLNLLLSCQWQQGDAAAIVSQTLRQLESRASGPCADSNLLKHFSQINALVDVDNIQDFVKNLNEATATDPWLVRACDSAMTGSPLSLALIFAQFKRTKHLSLAQAFDTELALSVAVCRRGDISEGIRALLIDKDRQPKWRFDSVEEVDPTFVAQMLN